MVILEKTVSGKEDLDLIYSGLGSISGKGRKHLKNTAQFLVALQNRPGTPIPDNICMNILQSSTNEPLNSLK